MVPWCLACGAPKLRSRPQSSRKPAGTHQCSLIPVLIALWEIWAGLGDWGAATGEGLPAGLRRVRAERVWTLPEGRRGRPLRPRAGKPAEVPKQGPSWELPSAPSEERVKSP